MAVTNKTFRLADPNGHDHGVRRQVLYSQVPDWRRHVQAGVTLAQAKAQAEAKASAVAAASRPSDDVAARQLADLSPSLAAVLRPQAAYRWLLPSVAAITPQYIESCLRGALAGNHVQAWELFDIMPDTDPEIASCMGEYLDGIGSKKFMVIPYADDDEEPSDQAVENAKIVGYALKNMRPDPANDENDARGTVRDIVAARFHGQSVIEVDWMDGYGSKALNFKKIPGMSGKFLMPRSTYWVHPCCYAWDMSGRLGLRMQLVNPDGTPNDPLVRAGTRLAADAHNNRPGSMVEPPVWNFIASQPRPSMLAAFPENKFLIGIMKAKTGTALGGSCLRPLAWWWCASNFCYDYLLNLSQLFGLPFRKATYKPGTSEPTKNEVRAMLQTCGSTGWALLPEQVNLEFESAAGGAGESPQSVFSKIADDMKRKVILHQTMTGGSTAGGSKGVGKSFGEVETDVKEQCIQSGADYACSVLNLQLVPSILKMNYGEDGDTELPTISLVDDDAGEFQDAQRDQLLSTIMDMPESYLRRKYRVPKPSAGDKLAGQETGTAGANMQFQKQQHDDQQQQAKSQQDFQQQQQDQQDSQQDQGESEDGKGESDGEDGNSMDENEARKAGKPGLQAKDADQGARDTIDDTSKEDAERVTKAFHNTVKPIVDRMDAIAKIKDPDVRKGMLEKFLADHGGAGNALTMDDSLAKVLEGIGARKFKAGLKPDV